MFLATCLTDYPSELRADLQRFYGIDLDSLGRGTTAWQMSACIANMPMGSKLAARFEPAAALNTTEHLLFGIIDSLAGKRVKRPWEKSDNGIPDHVSMPVDEFEQWYAKQFKDTEE